MDRGSYRHLLPAASSPQGGRQFPSPPDKSKPFKKRAHITKVACNACREKKSACDGRRPSCQMCVNRGSGCVYTSKDESETPTMALKRVNESLKQTTDALEELVNCLKFMPEETAQFILRKLRTASELDPGAILQSIRNDMELPTRYLSEQSTARAILPPIESEREFELMASHSNAYPILDPLVDRQLASSPTLRPPTPTNPIRRSKSRGVDSGSILYLASLTPPDTTTSSSSSGHKAQIPEQDPDLMVDSPETASDQLEFQFEKLNIGFWTTVTISDKQAADIITMYLSTDHPVLGLFDFELFVNDLVNCQFNHCSSFLLTSLLAFASQSYASKEPSSFARSYEFEDEAEKLWQIEGKSDSLTAIAGLALLSQSVGCHGQVRSTAKYLKALTAMAARMKLFGVEERLQVKDIANMSQQEQSSTSYTAWGAFNVITRVSAYFNLIPATPYHPAMPIPGAVRISQDGSEEKILVPLHPIMGQTFTYMCSLWTIVSEAMYLLRTETRSDRVPIAVSLSRYYQLLELADNLPKSMIRQERNAPHVLVFHIWFHAAIMEMFRPYIANEKQHDFRNWSSAAPTPHALFAASIRQLKRLMLIYFATHKPSHSIYWHTALLHVANAVLNDPGNVDSRFYFVTCIRGYAHLFTGFLVSKGIAQSLLAMALAKKAIPHQDAVQLIEELQNNDGSRRKLTDKSAGFVVDLDRAVNDPEGATVEKLSDQFEQITIFDAYTTGMMD